MIVTISPGATAPGNQAGPIHSAIQIERRRREFPDLAVAGFGEVYVSRRVRRYSAQPVELGRRAVSAIAAEAGRIHFPTTLATSSATYIAPVESKATSRGSDTDGPGPPLENVTGVDGVDGVRLAER